MKEERDRLNKMSQKQRDAYEKELQRKKDLDNKAKEEKLKEQERLAREKTKKVKAELERRRRYDPNAPIQPTYRRDRNLNRRIRILRRKEEAKSIKIRITSKDRAEQYVHTLSSSVRKRIRRMLRKGGKIVAIDPGKCDLIYATDGDTKESNFFRYSQDQRRRELKTKKYRDARNKLVEQAGLFLNQGTLMSIEQLQNSIPDHKTIDPDEFLNYIQKDFLASQHLKPFYSQIDFLRMQHAEFLNAKKADQQLIKRFRDIYGPPDKVIICIGDYDEKGHMKGKEPTKGRGIRDMFRNFGYTVYLVNEHRTSCRDCMTGKELEKFVRAVNPKFHIPERRIKKFNKYNERRQKELDGLKQELEAIQNSRSTKCPELRKDKGSEWIENLLVSPRKEEILRKELVKIEKRKAGMWRSLRNPVTMWRNFETGEKEMIPEEYKRRTYLRHGIMRSKDNDGVWNRDRNGAINIYKAAYNAIFGLERPQHLISVDNSGRDK